MQRSATGPASARQVDSHRNRWPPRTQPPSPVRVGHSSGDGDVQGTGDCRSRVDSGLGCLSVTWRVDACDGDICGQPIGVISLAVEIVTSALASVAVALSLLGLSIWSANTTLRTYPVARWLPLIFVLWVCCSFVLYFRDVGVSLTRSTGLRKAIGNAVRAIFSTWRVVQPLLWLAEQLVSVFTKALPLLWYRALKTIHERGAQFAFAAAGILLLMLSVTLQIASIALSP
jgi:hypothetical protein